MEGRGREGYIVGGRRKEREKRGRWTFGKKLRTGRQMHLNTLRANIMLCKMLYLTLQSMAHMHRLKRNTEYSNAPEIDLLGKTDR